jgi:hypothetical protein
MDQAELQRILWRHNALYLISGILLIPVAVALWLASFWVFRMLFYIPFSYTGNPRAWDISFWVAVAAILLLVYEGRRYTRPLFDLMDYSQSVYANNPITDSDFGTWNARSGGPIVWAYVISQFLFCAPRSSAIAVQSLRAVIRATPATLTRASEILTQLSQQRHWFAVSDLPNAGAALHVLDQLGLIWTRVENGEAQVRIPPGELDPSEV